MITRELPTEPGRYLWRVPSDNKWIFIEVFRIGLSRSLLARGDIYRNEIFEEFTERQLYDWRQQIGEWYRIPDPEDEDSWRTALADAICRPRGVIPDSAEGLVSQQDLKDAEARFNALRKERGEDNISISF